MKKMVLTALGLVGACAACCAIPLATPIIGALSAFGFSLLATCQFFPASVGAAIALVISVGGIVSAALWFVARQRKHAVIGQSSATCPLPTGNNGVGCGCAKGAS